MLRKSLFATLTMASVLSVNMAHAADGGINITGNITDQTCNIDAGSKAFDVDLDKVPARLFNGVGNTAGLTPFSISVTACPGAVTTINASFDGAAHNGDSSVLALDKSGTPATGVGIQIQEADGTVLPLFTPSKPVTLAAGAGTFNFQAAYVSTDTVVVAGDANATATYTVAYN